MISCVKDFQATQNNYFCHYLSRIRRNKKISYDLLYVPVLGFSNILRGKNPEECFVLHTDWNNSCLPELYLLISETFASVISRDWQRKNLFEVLTII